MNDWVAEGAREPATEVLSLLTPVLELAVIVAQTGERATPAVQAPNALRPFLQFTRRIPPPALRAARKVIDDDVAFRERVAGIATEALVGVSGMLFVNRPDGWENDLETLANETHDEMEDHSASRSDRKWERRLAGAESSARRAEAGLAKSRTDLALAQAAAAAERNARSALEEALEESRRANALLDNALQVATERIRGLDQEVTTLLSTCREADRELSSLREERSQRQTFAAAVAEALAAVDAVRTAIEDVHGTANDRLEPVDAIRPTLAPRAPTPSRLERASTVRSGRRPTVLPPAMFDDAPEAAHFLLRVPGVLVLVDGYNVSKWKWTSLSASDQRRRLVDVLEELAARTAADFQVIFDGTDADIVAEPAVAQGAGTRARRVRTSFSPPRVDADDVILDLIGVVAPGRAVVVVSSDRRVRQGSTERGANVISSQQFVAVWGSSGFLSHPVR